jgi:hypothetical protein
VFGDSHSSDISMSLRINGFDFIQLGGANCKLLNEAPNQPLYCNEIFKRFQSAMNERKIQTAILSNNFSYSELNTQNLSRIFSYWSQNYEKIIFFSPIPESIDLHREFYKFGKVTSSMSHKKHNLFYELIKSIDIPDNIIIANSADFLCLNDMQDCFILGNLPRMVDENHLSINGAKDFGKAFINDPSFQGVFD